MNTSNRNTLLAWQICFAILTSTARSTVLYWDPEATGAENATSLAAVWSATPQWSTVTSLSASPIAWVSGDAACFCAGTATVTTPFTVTVNSTMNVAGIYNGSLSPPGVFLTLGGTGALNLISGADAISAGGSDGGTTTFNIPLTGPGLVALEGSTPIFFNASNSFTGGTFFGYPGVANYSGTINFNNGSAFGTGPLQMTSAAATSTLQVEGTLPVTMTNSFIATNTTLNIVGNPAGLTFSGPWSLPATPNIGTGGSANLVTISGRISGTGGINKYNPGTLLLAASNTFTGAVTVSNGTFALGSNGSINSAISVTLAPGGNGTVFDVSANTNFTLGSNTTLIARGLSTSAVFAANLRGASNGTVNLGSNHIILSFTPTGIGDNTSHPPLYVSQGVLVLSNNTLTITNATTFALSAGSYRVIQVGDGNTGTIIGTPNPAVSVLGKGLVTGATAYLSTTNGDVNLIVQPMTSFSNLSTNQSNIFGLGVKQITLAGKISAGSVFPAPNESVTIAINNTSNNVPLSDATGDFSLTFDPGSVPYSATPFPLSYIYAGNGTLSPAVSNVTLVPNAFFINDQLPGFFSGLNLFFTNKSGINMYIWSSTNPGLPVTDWNLEGLMQEQPLNDGTGDSRYSINVTPATSPVYYISGPSLNWPYLSPAGVQWITTDGDGNYSYFTTNVSLTPTGLLGFLLPPTIVVEPVTNQTVLASKTVTLDVTVTGTRPMDYQWYFGNTALPGTTTNSPLVLPTVSTNQAGNYFVIVSNQFGSVTSSIASLSVLPQPRLRTVATNGTFQLLTTGVPGNTYLVESTTNISPPITWKAITTNTVDTNGVAQFIDTNLAVNSGLFYRLVFP